jgi:hypothetical protein
MKGGKLRCTRREDSVPGCIVLSCVDYEEGIFNGFKEIDCDETPEGWKKYYDVNAKANYWYNHNTGEATWIDPDSSYYGDKAYGKNKSKRRRRRMASRKHNSRKIKRSRKS